MSGPARFLRSRQLRAALGAAVLVVVVWRLGAGPVLHGVSSLDLPVLLAGAGIGVPVTVCCAWRWRLVARGLGVGLPLPAAVAGVYRAQLLNVTLPLGVLGDVHRAVRHGRDVGAPGAAARAVVWERTAGQVVQAAAALAVLPVLPSPLRSASRTGLVAAVLPVTAVVLAAGVALVLLGRQAAARRGGRSLPAVLLLRVAEDARRGPLAAAAWPGVLVASALAVVGHLLTFLLAARAVGVTAPISTLLPLGLVLLLAMAVPLSIAGWGPREGVAAASFAAAGLGADAGLSTAVAYGLLSVVAALPGLATLAGRRTVPAGVPAPSEEVARG